MPTLGAHEDPLVDRGERISSASTSAIRITSPRSCTGPRPARCRLRRGAALERDVDHVVVGEQDFHAKLPLTGPATSRGIVLASNPTHRRIGTLNGAAMNQIDLRGPQRDRHRRCLRYRTRRRAAIRRQRRPGRRLGPKAQAAREAWRRSSGGHRRSRSTSPTRPRCVARATADTVAPLRSHRHPRLQRRHHRAQSAHLRIRPAEWRQVLEINVNGVFLCNRAVGAR